MTHTMLFAFLLFSTAATITPGPNNIMVLASSASLGFARTLPLRLGVAFGMATLLLAVGIGLGSAIDALPALDAVLRAAGGGYLVFLAYRIATAAPPTVDGAARPIGFLGGAVFQWVNPKAWAVCISAAATYLPRGTEGADLAAFVALFGAVALGSTSLWASFGSVLRGLLERPASRRRFNYAMAALLLLSLIPILWS